MPKQQPLHFVARRRELRSINIDLDRSRERREPIRTQEDKSNVGEDPQSGDKLSSTSASRPIVVPHRSDHETYRDRDKDIAKPQTDHRQGRLGGEAAEKNSCRAFESLSSFCDDAIVGSPLCRSSVNIGANRGDQF